MASFDQRHQQVKKQINIAGNLSIAAPTSPEALHRQQGRSRMIEKVRGYWITGVLEPSLLGTAPIALGLSEQTRAVSDPWEPVFHRPQQSTQPLPTGTGVTQAYDRAGGELLILGDPGSGKTILLLELARDLLNRATQDQAHPIPVIFNLSSWATKRQSLTDWLVDELNTKYQVPRRLGQSWIATDQLLLLFDGLDEVAAEHRMACIDAINSYRQEHGLMPIVVCSRSADYPAQSLQLRCAIIIQPLTLQQIDAYLESISQPGEAIFEMLHHNPQLQELATSPLMLSVLIRTYSGQSLEALSDTGLPITQQQVFADYVELMLRRRGTTTRYTRQQTMRWLKWLAGQMHQHSQAEFYLERIQPDWLPSGRWRWLSYRIVARLGTSLLAGLLGGLLSLVLGGLLSGLSLFGYKELYAQMGLEPMLKVLWVFTLVSPLLLGLGVGLLVGLLHRMETDIKPAEVLHWSWRGMWRGVRTDVFLKGGLVTWLLFGLLFGLVTWLFSGLVGLVFGIVPGGLLGGVIGLISGLIGGLLFALFMMIFVLVMGFTLWPISGAISECVGKLSNSPLEQHIVIRPNQHRQRAGPGSLLVGFASGLVCGPLYGLFVGGFIGSVFEISFSRLGSGPGIGLFFGLMAGLVVTLLSGLANGLLIGFTYHVEAPLQPLPVVVRLWKNMLVGVVTNQSLRRGVSVGVASGLLSWLFLLLSPFWQVMEQQSIGASGPITWLILVLFGGLFVGLFYGWIFGLVRGIVSGLSSTILETQAIIRPNQGIQRSARNGMVVGLANWLVPVAFFALLGGLVIGLPAGLFFERIVPNFGLASALAVGLSGGGGVGLIIASVIGAENGLFYGGSACIQHSILRFLLCRSGYMPWNYVRFLDYAAERILLRKVGGGYIFVHRLLQEYFASLL